MSRVTVAQQNFSGGELSPSLAGRFDLSIYYNGASWLQNFIATVQGMARYRSGSKFAWNTRDNAEAVLIPFEYNTEQAYILEFTNNRIRIFKDGGLVTLTPQNITGITAANPAVVTYAGADTYANGDRVILAGILGMTELNNQEYIVANVNAGANTFELQGVNSSGFGAYVSGGTVAEIVEIVTTYTTAELFDIDFAQTNDTLYLVHPAHAPAKLTRSSHTAWTLTDVVFVSNPFGTTKAASQAITAATAANPVVVTYGGADTYANGDTVYIDGVVGMTQLNKRNYTVANVNAGANTFELQGVDGTSYTAYTSGGTIEEYTAFSYPSKVTFFEQRLIYAASDSFPQSLWGSQGGAYDNFLFGTGATDGFKYTLSSGQANRIRWLAATEEFLAIGTAGAEFKAEGGNNDPISPTNISIKPPSFYGSADVKPIRLDSHILYIQRDSITTRTFEFDAIQDGFTSINRNLTADTILQGRYGRPNGAKQIAFQSGSPSINWVVRNDGVLCGLTFEPREQVNGWHRHYAGGSYAAGKLFRPEYESVAAIPQTTAPDQVYTVTKRTIDGATVRYVEYFADQPNIPRFNDYFTGDKDADRDAFLQDLWEAQKRLWFVDSGIALDGTINQTGTLSDASVGVGRTFTAGGATFVAGDVGRQIWGKAGGRAVITGYTNATTVTVQVTKAFPDEAIASGEWYLTFSQISGLEHLEGQMAVGLIDGGVVENLEIEDGMVDLGTQASYAIIGLGYLGIYQSMDIEGGGDNGPGVTKQKSIAQVGVRFLNTLGALIGTDLYKLDRVKFRTTADLTGRPPPLFSGVKLVDVRDSWDAEKYIYCIQDKPLPCNIQLLVPRMITNDG
jgi:hypothetical protein